MSQYRILNSHEKYKSSAPMLNFDYRPIFYGFVFSLLFLGVYFYLFNESMSVVNILFSIKENFKSLGDKNFNRKYITANIDIEGHTGRFGNVLFRFAALYGIGRELGREVYFDGNNGEIRKNMPTLAEAFPNIHESIYLKFPIQNHIYKANEFGLPEYFFDHSVKKLRNISHKYLQIGGNYLQVYKYFHPKYKNEIRKLFECGGTQLEKVTKVANEVIRNDSSHLLCLHVRRTDFVQVAYQETTKEFVEASLKFAINYIKPNITSKNISTLFFGDDMDFVNTLNFSNLNIEKIHKSKDLTPAGDQCLARHVCNSMILSASMSSFGWWAAYLLPEGSPVFYNTKMAKNPKDSKQFYDYNLFLPEWIGLGVDDKGKAYRETRWWYERNNQTRPKDFDHKNFED